MIRLPGSFASKQEEHERMSWQVIFQERGTFIKLLRTLSGHLIAPAPLLTQVDPREVRFI